MVSSCLNSSAFYGSRFVISVCNLFGGYLVKCRFKNGVYHRWWSLHLNCRIFRVLFLLLNKLCTDNKGGHLKRTGTDYPILKIALRGDFEMGSRSYLVQLVKLCKNTKFHANTTIGISMKLGELDVLKQSTNNLK